MVEPSSVAEVIARMQAIFAPLPQSDGVACFVRLYLAVTEEVRRRLTGVTFADPAFMGRLDVGFANLFFAAADAAQAPPAWAPLFEARAQKGIAPLQFALAGMNAHINRDLPVALATLAAQGGY